MVEESLLDNLISSVDEIKQKRILTLFKENCTIKKLRQEIDKQIQEELNET